MAAVDAILCKISATNISSDLLTPEQRGRITIPTIGYQSVQPRPLGGKTWGENLTNYGGIGKLPFLGKTRTRDLYVTRGLKHFGSGFSQYEANVQPYQLTSLRKSACRVNDQILPATFKVEIDPTKYVLEPKSHQRQPYFSHRSIFEVFASHDPARKTHTGMPALTDHTRRSLQEQYRRIYDIPSYITMYPDNTDLIQHRIAQAHQYIRDHQAKPDIEPAQTVAVPPVEHPDTCIDNPEEIRGLGVIMSPLLDVLAEMSKMGKDTGAPDILAKVYEYYGLPVVVSILTTINAATGNESSRKRLARVLGTRGPFLMDKVSTFLEENDWSTENIMNFLSPEKGSQVFHDYERVYPVDTNRTGQQEDDQKTEATPIRKLQPYVTSANMSSFDGALIAENAAPPGKGAAIKGTAPVWPPSKCYVLNKQRMRLQSIDSFPTHIDLPQAEVQHDDSRKPQVARHLKKRVSFSDVITKYDPPRYLCKVGEKPVSVSHATSPGLPSYQQYLDGILPTAMSAGCNATVLPPADRSCQCPPRESQPVNSALPPLIDEWRTKSIVDPNQHLKTLAQRRYHANHPELVPDLRLNHRFSKKYFFSGYHTSTFRG